MQRSQSGPTYGTAHIVERQMLLHDALDKALKSSAAVRSQYRYRFVTISRVIGSLGDAIAQDLGARLGWLIYDKEIVDYIAHNSHVRQHLVHQLDERAQSLVHETIQRFLRMAEGGSFGIAEYRESLLKTLAFIATQGQAIIIGRGSNFALRNEGGGLHVRIVASQQTRAERLCLRWRVPSEEALWRMQEMDAERRNFIRHHFKQNIDDPCAYDLCINTDFVTPAQVADSLMGVIAGTSATRESKPRESNAPLAGLSVRSA